MPVKLERIGHCLIKVRDVEHSKKFYTEVLGFQMMEQDPDHGGVFLSLPGDGHTIDLSAVGDPATATPPVGQQDGVGVLHIAFKVGSYGALRESYDSLVADGVDVHRMMDHVSQPQPLLPRPRRQHVGGLLRVSKGPGALPRGPR